MTLGIRCKGQVQGVFFRISTKSVAENLGLVGWVKNEKSGDVLIRVAGEKDAVNNLVKWCQEGPEFAAVTELETWEEVDEEFESFSIRY